MIVNQIQHPVSEETDDRIWLLVSNKLADEATENELNELNYLLEENPETNDAVKLMCDWWDANNKESEEVTSHLLFQDILKKIK